MLSLSDPALGKVSRRGLLLRRIDIKHIKFAQHDDHDHDGDDHDVIDDHNDSYNGPEWLIMIIVMKMILMVLIKNNITDGVGPQRTQKLDWIILGKLALFTIPMWWYDDNDDDDDGSDDDDDELSDV